MAQNPAQTLKELLESGQSVQAYEAGKAAQDAWGDPAFDFYFGVAAVNAGQAGDGVLAMERYLMQFPENRSARFQLARGYFVLGEDLRAKDEFLDLLDGAAADEATVIQEFLDAIRQRESRYRPTSTIYAELGAMRDSNINSGLSSGPLSDLPGFVIVPGSTQEKESATGLTLAVGVNGTLPVSPGWVIYGGAHANGIRYGGNGNDQFNQQTLALQGGVTHISGRHLMRTGADLQKLSVGGQSYVSMVNLVGEWQYQVNQHNRITAGVNWGRLDYDNVLTYATKDKSLPPSVSGSDVRDSDLWSLNVGWHRSVAHAWNPYFSLGLNAGQESNRRSRPDLSRDFWGIKAGVSLRPAKRWTLGADVNLNHNRFGGAYAPGLSTREDDAWTTAVYASYMLNREWTVIGALQRTRQSSNISLHDYGRNVASIKVRYEFK